MGIRSKDIERTSPLAIPAYRPILILPPHASNTFAAAVAATAFSSPPYSYSLIRKTWGGASAVTVTVAEGAGAFESNETVTFEFVGFDEWGDPQTEVLTITGTGAATQYHHGKMLFTYLTSVRVLATTGTLGVETFALGTGGGAFATEPVYVPNPLPGLPIANWDLYVITRSDGGVTAPPTTPWAKTLATHRTDILRVVYGAGETGLNGSRQAAAIMRAGSSFDIGNL